MTDLEVRPVFDRQGRVAGWEILNPPTIRAYQEEQRMKEPMLQWFEYAHLPEHLQEVSRQFAAMAGWIVDNLPRNPERSVALRKLMEAKDCAVRARIYKEE